MLGYLIAGTFWKSLLKNILILIITKHWYWFLFYLYKFTNCNMKYNFLKFGPFRCTWGQIYIKILLGEPRHGGRGKGLAFLELSQANVLNLRVFPFSVQLLRVTIFFKMSTKVSYSRCPVRRVVFVASRNSLLWNFHR